MGFTWRHKFHWGSTPNRFTVIRLKKFFTVCVDLVFGSKCVQFREIYLLQCGTIINTFWVDVGPTQNYWKRFQWYPRIRTVARFTSKCWKPWPQQHNILQHVNSVALQSALYFWRINYVQNSLKTNLYL